ncbi:helix-turn-helix domain-containing protein [Streptomyces sp. McG6]|nr:helix-turn-helix domain-containing protein [Streptomyces sp. McG6]
MKVKDARKRTGLTQRQLAEHSGVSLSTIRKLEQGERSGARMETMHALARALRLPTMSLVTEPDEEGARAETRELWEPVRAELMRPPLARSTLPPRRAESPKSLQPRSRCTETTVSQNWRRCCPLSCETPTPCRTRAEAFESGYCSLRRAR